MNRSSIWKRVKWKYMVWILCVIVCISRVGMPINATGISADDKIVIALDPGHGGEEDGANYYGIQEKNLNLKMANLLSKELQQYSNVEVVLVRDTDEEVSLGERAQRASDVGADILLSMHFNASVSHKSNGASVYISTGTQRKEELMQFADCLLGEFEAIGLENAGMFARVTQMGSRREDGSFSDYYGVLRHAYNYGIPAMIIEHCYMDSEIDKEFFYTEEGLKKLAKADADGIAAYYGLRTQDGDVVQRKGAAVFGATTKAVELDYYESPNINGIRLIDYDGKTPGIATYQIEVEDGVGVSNIYLVYKNQNEDSSFTIYLNLEESLVTGIHEVTAYFPSNLSLGECKLVYIGASNEAGLDAGYNLWQGTMVGYGKCDWLNTFNYSGEANLQVMEQTKITPIQTKHILEELLQDIRQGKRGFILS